MTHYTPLTADELIILAAILGAEQPNWSGPALPRPQGLDGFSELVATVNRLAASGQSIIQMQDGLSIPYTLQGVTAPAERFIFGPETAVELAAGLRDILIHIESFVAQIGLVPNDASGQAAPSSNPGPLHQHLAAAKARVEGFAASLVGRCRAVAATVPTSRDAGHQVRSPTFGNAASAFGTTAAADGNGPPSPTADYSAFALESPDQFAMAWSTFEDVFRHGFEAARTNPDAYAGILTDKANATANFWPTLSRVALPFNLLVLRRLDPSTIEPYASAFGQDVIESYAADLKAGRLYGIDMSIFAGMPPHELPNGTVRFTPCTMTLLVMDASKALTPVAVCVTDPMNHSRSQVYTQACNGWIYALMAAKTSLTVYGIWLGHVYSLHLVTAAVQMATWNELPPVHIVFQALAPQSRFTIGFDLVLMIGWSRIAPPTSISDFGKFLNLCARYGDQHDFFSTDPHEALAALNLDAADFTGPDGVPWGLFPNVAKMLRVWDLTAEYAKQVVDAGYSNDSEVANDAALQRWIAAAGAGDGGNVVGLPKLDGKAALTGLLTSLLYRVNFHGAGRLRSVSGYEISYIPNYPPCLQSTDIPDPDAPLPVEELLAKYMPRTGTIGSQIAFYGTFGFTAPVEPMVPYRGPGSEPFFSGAHADKANDALAGLQRNIAAIIAEMEPSWIQTGQWPRNIEL